MDRHIMEHGYSISLSSGTTEVPPVDVFMSTKPDGTSIDSPRKARQNKQSKSNRICCIPGCHTTGYDEIDGHGKPSYHSFPGVDNPLRTVWVNKIKRDEGPNFKIMSHTVVCSLHFEEDTLETSGFSNRKYLKSGAVPTKFDCWENKVHFYTPQRVRKRNRLQNKRDEPNVHSSFTVDEITDNDSNTNDQLIADSTSNGCSTESQVETAELHRDFLLEHLQFVQNNSNTVRQENEILKSEIKKLKRENDSNLFCVENLKSTEFPFYTGFPSKEVFDIVLELVYPGERGENIVMYAQKDNDNETPMIKKPRKLSPANQFNGYCNSDPIIQYYRPNNP